MMADGSGYRNLAAVELPIISHETGDNNLGTTKLICVRADTSAKQLICATGYVT